MINSNINTNKDRFNYNLNLNLMLDVMNIIRPFDKSKVSGVGTSDLVQTVRETFERNEFTPSEKKLEKELKRIVNSIPQDEELQSIRRVSIKELLEHRDIDRETIKETFNNGVKDVIVVWTIHEGYNNKMYDRLYFVTELKNIKTNIESRWSIWNGPFFTRDLKQQKEFIKNFYIREEGYNKYNVSSNNGTELFMDGNKLVNISK